ncbi:hypothetical protein [Rhizobium halophytocola]|uniref:Uncharacterized protein n=1 Tax=Rhizobium halophytocola TaxID=735519 RepID=A0ABS4E1Z9_9HYPH|nr:hypothetical protein [Rhizobium halophytocola]MBP1851963.1 hypothetical protein [Rhizobium halophytocola]
MTNLRSLVLAAGGLVILAAAAAFTLSLTLLVGALLTVTLGTRMLASRLRNAQVPVRARRQPETLRVWNDGRGTIIDL